MVIIGGLKSSIFLGRLSEMTFDRGENSIGISLMLQFKIYCFHHETHFVGVDKFLNFVNVYVHIGRITNVSIEFMEAISKMEYQNNGDSYDNWFYQFAAFYADVKFYERIMLMFHSGSRTATLKIVWTKWSRNKEETLNKFRAYLFFTIHHNCLNLQWNENKLIAAPAFALIRYFCSLITLAQKTLL